MRKQMCDLCFCRGCEYKQVKKHRLNDVLNWCGVVFIALLVGYAIFTIIR